MPPTDLYDAVNANAIPADAPAVAGYLDGSVSAWSAEEWQRFADVPRRRITVLADPAGDTFDAETGNASNDEVAGAVAGRLGNGKASWAYTNKDNYADLTRALASKSLKWSDRSQWPAPGVYLWAADPSGHLADGTWRVDADPVAVQDRYEGGYDVSTCYVELTATQPAPGSVPQPVGDRVRHDLSFTTDADGNGWQETSIPWSTFEAVSIEGSYPPADGYWPGVAKAQDRDGFVCVSVVGFRPNSAIQVYVLASE